MAGKKATNAQKAIRREPAPAETARSSFDRWLDLAANFATRFGRFGWDVVGVLLLAFALMMALALTGLTSGALLTPLAGSLRYGFGWGSALLAAGAAAGGVVALIHRNLRWSMSAFYRLLALEGASFAFLALLSIFGGDSLERAEMGLDGGIIGWGLAQLLLAFGIPSILRTILVTGIFLLFALSGLGVFAWMRRLLERAVQPIPEVGEEFSEAPPAGPPSGVIVGEAAESGPKSPEAARQKRKASLPPEYRKSFRVEERQAEKPAAPFQRDERLPPLNLLLDEQSIRPDERHINLTAGLIEKTLAEFGVPARVVGFRIGPTVTQFAVEPGFVEKPGPDGEPARQKVRVSQISALARDLALALSAERLRIEAPVPGRSYVGIEVPNSRSSIVRLRPMLESDAFYRIGSPLAIALGRDVSGQAVVADLARMPHLLIAGTTGSGKSVCIAAITTCLIMNNTPEDLRIAMIDPKMVELVRFNGTPHLLGKVETDLERILGVLRWSLGEMDRRYHLLEDAKARDIEVYNRRMQRRKQPTLPRIVIVIDELADLMMSAPDQTEHSLVRLAQMARATGIHLVLATQRPSTDVVTGLIKANFPARISFTVASSVDSRVILDTAGAETLLGRGDMLFLNPEAGAPVRAQGVMVTDQEIERVIEFWQKMSPMDENEAPPWEQTLSESEQASDELIEQAIAVVRKVQRASASLLQRRLRIGYPRAARLMDELESLGVVGPSQGAGREREVLIEPDEGGEEREEDGEYLE
jgi:S-DNA-T family DNA segregation ATPase FtsK/SpoIIIE